MVRRVAILMALVLAAALPLGSIAQAKGKPPKGAKGNGSSAVTSATFSPDHLSVVTTSTKDLSNVVLEFEDGTHQKFDGLSGPTGTFSGTEDNEDKMILGVWVKSGNNKSGDGPGYGARHDNTACCSTEDPADETPSDPLDGFDFSDYVDPFDGGGVIFF